MHWAWWMTAGVIFIVLVWIGLIPLKIDLSYEQTFSAQVKVWFFGVWTLGKKKSEKKPKKSSSKAAESKKAAAPAKTEKSQNASKQSVSPVRLLLSNGAEGVLELLRLVSDFLGKLRRKLRVEELTLQFYIGAEDAAQAAVAYGKAWACIGAMMPLLDRLFIIKKRDIQPHLDYNKPNIKFSGRFILSITVGRLLGLLIQYGIKGYQFYQNLKKGGTNV